MDQPASDGQFYYSNKELGFSLVLPAQFEYYQVQRLETEDYIDIEFFVPTVDSETFLNLVGYAQPLVVRIFKKEQIDELGFYEKIAEENNWIYTMKFWQTIPSDWTEKWSEEIKQEIKKSFKII